MYFLSGGRECHFAPPEGSEGDYRNLREDCEMALTVPVCYNALQGCPLLFVAE